MKLIEVLIAMLVFSLFTYGVMTQLDAEAKFYLHRIDKLNELDTRIELLKK